jgi:hypothetical protein
VEVPGLEDMKAMAMLSGKGLIRDLGYSTNLVTGSASLTLAVLVSSLDSGGPNSGTAQHQRPTGAVPCCGTTGGGPFASPLPGGQRQTPPVTITGVAPWAAGVAGRALPGRGLNPKQHKGLGFTAGNSGMPMTVAPFRNSNPQTTIAPAAASALRGAPPLLPVGSARTLPVSVHDYSCKQRC